MFEQILKAPNNFFLPIAQNLALKGFVKVHDTLVVIKKQAIFEHDSIFDIATGHAASHSYVGTLYVRSLRQRDGDLTKQLITNSFIKIKISLEQTGKIEGFELLNLRTMDKLWISFNDAEILQIYRNQ